MQISATAPTSTVSILAEGEGLLAVSAIETLNRRLLPCLGLDSSAGAIVPAARTAPTSAALTRA